MRKDSQSHRSSRLFERAQNFIPGGVNSPARAFRAVGGKPPFIARGDGPSLFDEDGNKYIDLVGSWGPLILGHRHPAVIEALNNALETGTSFGAPTEQEVEIAELIGTLVPSVEMVRLVNSGTEATMSAIRLARGYTKRDLVVKFVGCYHGHVDSLLVKAGSGLATLGISDSGGVPKSLSATTIPLPYNSAEVVEDCFRRYGDQIACVIIEPVAGNMGCVPPVEGYLDMLREITSNHGSLLILDEVMTGFRVSAGGAQTLYGIQPDLTTLGKVIGGGLPVGAYGGRRDVMEHVAPLGPVYQAGTLSGNPLAVAAGLATLRTLQQNPGIFQQLEDNSEILARGLARAAKRVNIPVTINRVGSMFTVFFADDPVIDFDSASKSDTTRFGKFFHGMLKSGVYLPCSQFEAAFLSAAHSQTEIDKIVSEAENILANLAKDTAQ